MDKIRQPIDLLENFNTIRQITINAIISLCELKLIYVEEEALTPTNQIRQGRQFELPQSQNFEKKNCLKLLVFFF